MQEIAMSEKLNAKELKLEQQRETAKKIIQPVIDGLNFYAIPEEKLEAVIEYTCLFVAKNRHRFTYARMVRKIADYFHLKLKPEHQNK